MDGDKSSDFVSGFNPDYKGRKAECDGGAQIAETKYAGRQYFAGTLSGDYRDFGPYPWRWYLLTELTLKPENYVHEAVWCDEGSIVFTDKK
jgi:hypothetical protein